MNPLLRVVLITAALSLGAAAADLAAPVQNENLQYSLNWPSGLSLGEGRLLSHEAAGKWSFEMVLDAGVPGFAVSDHFRSTANADLCSADFERETLHGKRKTRERTTFDYQKNQAQRVTLNGGGKSTTKIGGCVRDALTYIFFARRELGRGRVPPAEQVFYGSQYQVKVEFNGPQTITYSEKHAKADRVTVSLKGPASNFTFEIFFAQDGPRTPLLIKLPLSAGMVSAELVK